MFHRGGHVAQRQRLWVALLDGLEYLDEQWFPVFAQVVHHVGGNPCSRAITQWPVARAPERSTASTDCAVHAGRYAEAQVISFALVSAVPRILDLGCLHPQLGRHTNVHPPRRSRSGEFASAATGALDWWVAYLTIASSP